jgi:hypothetical protein
MKQFNLTDWQNVRIVKANESLPTYEESELKCLKKLIELVKEK